MVANRWRCGAIFLASVCIVWVAFISSSAQLKGKRQVTSVEMVQRAEGARVTVNSDSALNDYEAFRRGDRFYVKIPLAEFAFSQPRFRGNGFDDVQVQKVDDSVVVSFKLQVGASAYVEQHANRLEVIFTAANRGQYASVSANRGSSAAKESRGNQGSQDRQSDAAGPVPSEGPQVSRQRYTSGRAPEINVAQRQPRNVRAENNQSRTEASDNPPVASSTPLSVASPTPVPNYPAASAYTPTLSATPLSKPAVISANSPNSKLREWFSANPKAALLGALILAGLAALAAVFLYRGRKTESNGIRAKRPLAQPKYDSSMELAETTDSPAEPVIEPITQHAPKSEWGRAASTPAFAPAAEVAATRASAFSKSSNRAVAVADLKSGSEEREVFEL